MGLLWDCDVIAMGLLCDCYAIAMRLLCDCYAIAMPLRRTRGPRYRERGGERSVLQSGMDT